MASMAREHSLGGDGGVELRLIPQSAQDTVIDETKSTDKKSLGTSPTLGCDDVDISVCNLPC